MDPKMRLQYCLNEFNTHEGLEGSRQALRKTFCVLDEWGPSHERMYLVGCYINEQLIAQAQSPPHLPLCISAFASPSNLRRICAASGIISAGRARRSLCVRVGVRKPHAQRVAYSGGSRHTRRDTCLSSLVERGLARGEMCTHSRCNTH